MANALPAEASSFLREYLGEEWTAHPLAGDASVRVYYRVRRPDGATFMLAYYPQEVRSQLKRFMDAYEAVAGVARVPEVIHHGDYAVLQHDVGDVTLFDLLHRDRGEGIRRYREAIDLLIGFQKSSASALNPPFTADSFYAELEMTREFYVEKLMGRPAAEADRLRSYFRMLCEKIAEHPYALCHRDYHGQNIHILNDMLYAIDYQDMRMGPDTYDLASLLRDRGVARILGDTSELELIDTYRRQRSAGHDLYHRYFETLLQRSIKILGTYSKQPIVRGKLHYLEFIPSTLESIGRCLHELPYFQPLESLMPMDFSIDEVRRRLQAHG